MDKNDWNELTDSQQWAAAAFCYFSDTWNDVALPDMSDIPTLYPYFRYVEWDDLPASQQGLALQAGWDDVSWNTPEKAAIENKPFSELDDPVVQALIEMGFYEEQYDCYINHYYGYTWEDLTLYGLAKYYEAFGWSEEVYSVQDPVPPAAWEADWDTLTDAQKDAADHLCIQCRRQAFAVGCSNHKKA